MLGAVFLVPLLALAASVAAQSCDTSSKCPSSAPCCSPYGFCGSGTFCAGGCNPLASNSLTSCNPNPSCKSGTYNFGDTNRIVKADDYDGDPTKHDWTLDTGDMAIQDGSLQFILTKDNGGTKISSTRYVHYGTITASMKTGRWGGVVAAFITMSDIKDEIDWEFPGNSTTSGQTNFFWQGVVTNPTHGEIEKNVPDTFNNYNTYTIDWQPDQMNFQVNGKTVRSIQASDFKKGGVSQYPNTPSRVQLSLWPAGINSSAPGTIQWAGGVINWDDADYKKDGHFASLLKSVTIKCSDNLANGVTSYYYGTNSSTNTPGIKTSTKALTTNNNGGSSGGSKIFTPAVIGGIAGGAVVALIIVALLVRACTQRKPRRTTPIVGDKYSGQVYTPLQENHSMPNLGPTGYNPPQHNSQPSYPQASPYAPSSQFTGGQYNQYNSQPAYNQYQR